jgi:hypothetical protein
MFILLSLYLLNNKNGINTIEVTEAIVNLLVQFNEITFLQKPTN